MNTSFCTLQQGIDFIGSLHSNPNDPTMNPTTLQKVNIRYADELRRILKKFGMLDSNANPEPSDQFQTNILTGINAEMMGQYLMDARSIEIDPLIFNLKKIQQDFTLGDKKLMEQNKLYSGWDQGLPLPLPTIRPSWREIIFTGVGLNDLQAVGDFTDEDSRIFIVVIVDPTHFKWKRDNGGFSGPILITGLPQALSGGISIILSTNPHTANDQWEVDLNVPASTDILTTLCPGWEPLKSDGSLNPNATPLKAVADNWLDWKTAIVYSLAATFGYPLNNLNQAQAEKYADIINPAVAALINQCRGFQDRRLQITNGALANIAEFNAQRDALIAGKFHDVFEA